MQLVLPHAAKDGNGYWAVAGWYLHPLSSGVQVRAKWRMECSAGTWHAELLPHTEQVVFHKAALFGGVRRHTVDIKNLEKIDAATLPVPLMWDVNMFDD